MSERNSKRATDKLANKSDEKTSQQNKPEINMARHNRRRSARLERNPIHRYEEIDDEFEEFESAHRIEPEPSTEDKVTIWMNSWMDEDDGDFRIILEDRQKFLKP